MDILKKLIISSILLSSLEATTLKESVEQVIRSNSEIIAEHFNKKAYYYDIQSEKSAYLPTIDFTSNIKKENISEDKTNSTVATPDTKIMGWNAKVNLEQILYDGDKTAYNIIKATTKYHNIKHLSNKKIEDLVLDTINTYNELASYQELISMDKFKIKVHKKYLVMAKEKEEISGEILDTFLVNSKIKSIIDHFLEQEVSQQKAFAQYKKLTNKDLSDNICRPIINKSIIPINIEDAIEKTIKNNSEILAQEERIKEQYLKINSLNSNYKPTVKLNMSVEQDNDIKLEDNGQTDTYNLSLQANWNIYNGGKDDLSVQKEKIILLEQKKILDTLTADITSKIKGSYYTYKKLEKRIENIKEYILDNKAIVNIYNEQLKDGTKTFLDLLNSETELFRTKILLINTEFLLLDEYYQLLRYLNILSDSILIEKDQICGKYIFNDNEYKFNQKTQDQISDELGLD